MRLLCRALFACLLLAAGLSHSQPVELEQLQDVPPPPEPVVSGEVLEPEITIIRGEETTIEEYRINGHLYAVQVKPVIGPTYYLLDNDGDGHLESRVDEVYNRNVVPSWVLISWD
jgi:hypothetical protein